MEKTPTKEQILDWMCEHDGCEFVKDFTRHFGIAPEKILEEDYNNEDEDRWVSFTRDSFATDEDWETLCDEAECLPDETSRIVVHISAIDCEFDDDSKCE